jgi:two-component system NarL family sensor kinase
MEKGDQNHALPCPYLYNIPKSFYCIRRTTWLFVAMLTTSLLNAQSQHYIDSLKKDIDQFPAPDSFRVKAIYKYLKGNLNNNNSNDLPYIQEIIHIGKKDNYRYGVKRGFQMAVGYYGDRGDFTTSFIYADSLSEFLKNDTSYDAHRERGILYSNRANNYHKMAYYEKAVENNLLAAGTFEKLKDTPFVIQLYLNISDVYSRMDDTVKSPEYTQKAVQLAEAYGNDQYTSIASLGYAADLATRGNFKKAQDILTKVLPLLQKIDNSSFWQSYYYISGSTVQRQGNYAQSIPLLQQSLSYARTNDDIHQKTGVMEQLYTSYLKMKDIDHAKPFLDTVFQLSQSAGLEMRRKTVYDGLADWYALKGDHSNEALYLRRSAKLNDSILSEAHKKQIASLEIKYQVAQKENEIKILGDEKKIQQLDITQKTTLNYLLIIGALVLLLILFLLYRSYHQKQKLQQQRIAELETQQQLMATEAVLKGEEQERSRLAKDLHDGLGGMLSGIKYSLNTVKGNLIMTPDNTRAFERSMDMLDSSIKEMRRVAHNMMPEALVKFGLDTALKDFSHEINQTGALSVNYQSIGLEGAVMDQTTAITIYRIIQELINNTIKHAAAKTAIVQVAKTGDQLTVTIEDDGKGFDTALLKQAKGMGWSNIQNRVDFLKGKLDVHSGEGKGTSVFIELEA